MGVISVYGKEKTDYTKNGLAVLSPISCIITEKAGAMYEAALEYPIAQDGKWEYLQLENILKIIGPAQYIESTISGQDVEVWVTTSFARVYSAPAITYRITYDPYVSMVQEYFAGDRVTMYSGATPGQNYQCLKHVPLHSSSTTTPGTTTGKNYWKEISNYSYGGDVLEEMETGTEFYVTEDYNQSWVKAQTRNGIEGYVQKSNAVFVREEHIEPVPPREIAEQLFRIYNVELDSARMTVRVNAQQVSYDLTGNLLQACAITNTSPGGALVRMKDAMVSRPECTLATNLTQETDGAYSNDLSWRTATFALLDPDKGFASYYRARVVRDKWDIFFLRNSQTYNGIQLRYGKNIRGIRWKRNTDRVINRIIPVARDEDGNDYFLPALYVDSPDIGSYAVTRMERLEVDAQLGQEGPEGEEWTEETLQQYMHEKAMERFLTDHVDAAGVEIKVDFTMLGDTEEAAQYKKLQHLALYDTVLATYEPFHLSESLQVSEYEWDAVNERYNSITLGTLFAYGDGTVSGYELRKGAIELEKLSSAALSALKGA